MLYSSTFSNFASFSSDAIFDLAAPKNRVRNRYPGNFVQLESGERVLKDAVLVGENAGGKSNFVKAFKFLRSLFARNDVAPRSYDNLVFSLGSADNDGGADQSTLQPFEVELAIGDHFLRYTLRLDAQGVVLEKLERFDRPNGKSDLVFALQRRDDERRFCGECADADQCEESASDGYCQSYRMAYDKTLGVTRELLESLFTSEIDASRLMVVTLSTLGEQSCRELVSWFTTDLVIASRSSGGFSIEGISGDDLERILNDGRYFEILRLADSSISEVKIDRDRPFRDSVLVRTMPSGRVFERAIGDDSTGVNHFAQWAVAVYLVVYRNKTVFADEIDSAINPVLSERVLAFINGNEHRGQFIFTTHNVLNLTFRTFMKEQIYFVTKDVEILASSMYSLADFSDVRYDVKGEIYDLYMRGLLGGTQDV